MSGSIDVYNPWKSTTKDRNIVHSKIQGETNLEFYNRVYRPDLVSAD